MKKYLLIFLITLFAFQSCICQETAGEWTTLTFADITPGGVADKASSFGVWFVKAEKIGNAQIANSTWNLKNTNSMASRKADAGYTDYKFNVTEADQETPANNFTTEYVVRASDNQDQTILYRVLSYTSRTLVTSAVGVAAANAPVETSVSYSILEEIYQYGNASTLQQTLNAATFTPESEQVLTNGWVEVDEQTWTSDTTLQQWSKNAGAAAIDKAAEEETIDSVDNWYVYYIYASSQDFDGVTYYRFDFILSNNANTKLARGNSYVTKDQDGNYQLLTSGISSLENAA